MSALDLRAIARALRGEFVGGCVLAPGPGHSPRDRSLSVKISATAPDGFLVFSHAGDDWRSCRDYVRERVGLERGKRPARPSRPPPASRSGDNARNLAIAARIVCELRPIAGTAGEHFLGKMRNIDPAVIADVLERTDAIGWHAACLFCHEGHPLDSQRLGCIVGIMTDPVTAKPTGAISRTFIDGNLRKVGKAKSLGTPTGVVRLSRDEDVLGGLHIAEGLETALFGMSFFDQRPMWSTGSDGLMATFPVIAGIESLTVFADHDASGAGEKAARKVEQRWLRASREAHIYRSDRLGDLNDALGGRDS